MKNSFIPIILKDKISLFFNYFLSFIFILIALFITISLSTFNINDDSFLTSSSLPTTNLAGNVGSYFASFVFYTFGITGYGIIVFFVILSILTFFKKRPSFIFIRLLIFFLSLVLLPQVLIHLKINFLNMNHILTWGIFAEKIYLYHSNNYISYLLSFIGLISFTISQNIFYLGFNFRFIKNKTKSRKNINTFKKDPIINFQKTKIEKDSISLQINGEREIKKEDFKTPSTEILESFSDKSNYKSNKETIEKNSRLLEEVFADFNLEIKVINVKLGPVITLYEILPAPGIKINTIINLAGDISRSMGVGAVRIAQVYGTQYLGVEVPNEKREMVSIKELLVDNNFKNSPHKIPICIGKDISGNIEVIDLSKTPHLLVAGTTGSGKSVFINNLLASLLYKFSPDDLRLILIDPKMLELSVYNDIAHLLTPVVTEPKKSIIALKWVCKEMERRYVLMNELSTRSLEGYNQSSKDKLPYIVVFIDEMADLMMTAGKEVEHYVQRLAQMARACGIHLVMATQRPSVDIITGSIKANFPSRISFQVASKYDSRTVLGEIGAEQLLGNGDMLMSKNGSSLMRYQSAFISDKEVNKLINEIKNSQTVEYLQELDEIIQNEDENFESLGDEDEELITKSIDLIKNSNKASTSYLQRNFQIGYNKAARIMETLEKRGIVSEPNRVGKREILINN